MKKVILILFFSLILVPSSLALAQNDKGSSGSSSCCPSGTAAGTTCLCNPLGSNTSPQVLIGNIINAVMGIVGSIALLMFIFGGLTWMLSGGSAEKVKKGRDILIWSAIGLVVIFSSYAIVYFVITKIK